MQISNEHKLKYLNRRKLEIEELMSFLSDENYEGAVMIGHRLKGNGQTFGFPDISTIGISIEKAALAKNKILLKELTDKLVLKVDESLAKLEM